MSPRGSVNLAPPPLFLPSSPNPCQRLPEPPTAGQAHTVEAVGHYQPSPALLWPRVSQPLLQAPGSLQDLQVQPRKLGLGQAIAGLPTVPAGVSRAWLLDGQRAPVHLREESWESSFPQRAPGGQPLTIFPRGTETAPGATPCPETQLSLAWKSKKNTQ